MRVVLTTNDSVFGQRIMRALAESGAPPDAVVLLGSGLGPAWSRRRSRARTLAAWPLTAARGLARWYRLRVVRAPRYRAFGPKVYVSGRINSASTHRVLRALAPDLLVLGGGGILTEETIALARVGALNAHPGLLPWMRGNGPVGHSLSEGVAVGATVHLVDRTIDTGPILARRLLPVGPGPRTVAELEVDVYELAARLLAEVVASTVRSGHLPPAAAQRERHPLFRWPDLEGARAQDALAQAGRAGELFDRWRCLCTSGWNLPPDVERPG